MCLDLAFQSFSLLCCRQPSPTNQACAHQRTPTGPWQLSPHKETRANYNSSSIQTKGRNRQIKYKQVHIKKNAKHFSSKYVQWVLNVNFDFQTSFLPLISPFCSKCAKSTWCPCAQKQTHLGGKSSQCANLLINFTASCTRSKDKSK